MRQHCLCRSVSRLSVEYFVCSGAHPLHRGLLLFQLPQVYGVPPSLRNWLPGAVAAIFGVGLKFVAEVRASGRRIEAADVLWDPQVDHAAIIPRKSHLGGVACSGYA